MKLTTLSTLALAAAGLVSADNAALCAAKNAGLMTAIDKFCAKTNMVVPSTYTGHDGGAQSPDKHTKIWIDGYCTPPQWIPQQYYYSQFYEMCAKGGKHGGSVKDFGKKDSKYSPPCQVWNIQYKHQPGKGW